MKDSESTQKNKSTFTSYEKFVIAILAILQFTVILDFMVLSPLSAILLDELNINTTQFGLVVSGYAFSAGAAGFLAAGFADKFDRKKMLLFFYTGFLLGTFLCAISNTYEWLLFARIITGIFGGVIGSIGFAIITDLFKMEVRGRVMSYIQMAFAASQVLGLPIGLYLANHYGWQSPFYMIGFFGIIVGIIMIVYLKPINMHLTIPKNNKNAFQHIVSILLNKDYRRAFWGTILLATGGFMLMPFGSAFSTKNLGISMDQLPLLFGITGVFAIITSPIVGKMSDKMDKFKLFLIGTIISIAMAAIYTNLEITPLYLVIIINVIMFVGINSRIISANSLLTGIPEPQDRGAFMSVNSSIQQVSGGVASYIAGLIVVKTPSGYLENYGWLGLTVIGSMIVATFLIYRLNNMVKARLVAKKPILH